MLRRGGRRGAVHRGAETLKLPSPRSAPRSVASSGYSAHALPSRPSPLVPTDAGLELLRSPDGC